MNKAFRFMTATYTIYKQHNLKYVHVSGKTHLEELRALALKYRDDPAYSPHLRQLVDLSDLTDARARFKDVWTLRNFYLRTFGPIAAPIPVAIVAPTDLGYGISKMFSSLMFGQNLMNIEVLSTFSQAKHWLGGTFPDGLTDIPA